MNDNTYLIVDFATMLGMVVLIFKYNPPAFGVVGFVLSFAMTASAAVSTIIHMLKST